MWLTRPRVRLHSNMLSDCTRLLQRLQEQGIEVDAGEGCQSHTGSAESILTTDLVLIDQGELLNWYRHYMAAGVPIILLVQDTLSLQQRRQLFQQGIVDYIQLPLVDTELINRVLAYLHFYGDVKSDKTLQGKIKSLQRFDLVETTCDYLCAHLSEQLALDALCRRLGTNRNTLSRRFKLRYGQGVYAWLRAKRMSVAKHLLTNTDWTVQQISQEVGYGNAANFSTAFRAQFGISPSQMRKTVTQSKQWVTHSKDVVML